VAGVETRELRYFVAVAEELHFGRAAQRLGMAQPPLSRSIAQLERRLGTTLLERTSRGVTLTGPGAVLLEEARAALAAVAAAERRTRRAAEAAEGKPAVALVAKAGASTELVAKLLDAYAGEPGAVGVDVILCGPGQQGRMLREGHAVSEEELLAHVATRFTKWWLPEAIEFVAQIPRTPTGKFLKRALRDQFRDYRFPIPDAEDEEASAA